MAYPINDNPSYVIENSKETVIAEAIKKAIIKNIRNNNKDEITRLIAKYKIDINHQDIDGNTFLHHAIENRSKQAAEALLELNPDLSLKNNKNYTAEEYAQTKNNDDIRKILQHRRQRGALNNFVLQAIRDNNKSEVTKLIKEENLDINYQDNGGNTFLHYAAMHGKEKALAALVELNPDLSLRNNDGVTAKGLLDHTRDTEMQDMVKPKNRISVSRTANTVTTVITDTGKRGKTSSRTPSPTGVAEQQRRGSGRF